MRIIHVVPRIAEEASGPSYSVPALCKALADEGCRIELVTLDGGRAVEHRGVEHRRHRVSLSMHRLGLSFAMNKNLRRSVRSADIIHSHSLWMLPNVYPAWAARGERIPLVISPRGTLSSWSLRRSRFVKKIFWRLQQGAAVRQAACLHATSDQELADIRAMGLEMPVTVVPNGIDVPPLPSKAAVTGAPRRLLYLGRLHPKKGIDTLLNAWAIVCCDHPDWTLEIVGRDEGGYRGELERLAAHLNLSGVSFAGPKYGVEKWTAYSKADLYILPTHSENFGLTVAEAMAMGVPVITTIGTPWVNLDKRGVGWTVNTDQHAVAAALRLAFATPSGELAAMGRRGRDWMISQFAWKPIARQMIDVYRWLLEGGHPPDSISSFSR